MKRRPALVLSALVVALAGCGAGDADDDRLDVVTSFYPATFLAERIGGDLVDVTTLTSPGTEAHDLELSAKQVIALNEAAVVVHLSQFQPAVDHAVAEAERDPATTADMAAGVAPLESVEEHEHDDHEGHGHEHAGGDPHLWLAPASMITAAETVRDALIAADPEHAEAYERNAAALRGDLEALDAEFRAGLARCERRDFVTSHAAFGHLAHAYDLHQIAISGLDPHAEPSTAALARITDLVRAEGITTVFTERLASPALAETVARETGARTAVLDPIEGLTEETADEDYLSLMRQNLAALQEANGCS